MQQVRHQCLVHRCRILTIVAEASDDIESLAVLARADNEFVPVRCRRQDFVAPIPLLPCVINKDCAGFNLVRCGEERIPFFSHGEVLRRWAFYAFQFAL